MPKTEDALLSQTTVRFRPVAALDLRKGQIALGQTLAEVRGQLGAEASTAPGGAGNQRREARFPNQGIKVIGTDEVLALAPCSDRASAVSIREMGLGTKFIQLKVGMTSAELDRLLGDSDYDFRQLVDPDLNYRFYADLGIAVFSQGGKVSELVISQIPKKRVGF